MKESSMGVLNRIVLIFILLAAAGATILSYFLFEKRTDLMKGWDLMANQIDATAKNLDKGQDSLSVYLSGNGPLVEVLREALKKSVKTKEKDI